jgi:hypothetical protein
MGKNPYCNTGPFSGSIPVKMKRKLILSFCVLALSFASVTRVSADNGNGGGAMMADAVIARPLCLAATIVGTAFFVISLPISLMTGSTERARDALVVTPAKATFQRPLGDLDGLTR